MLIFGVILVVLSLALLFYSLNLFGETETAAAKRLREAIDVEPVVGGSKKLTDDATESFARKYTPVGLVEKLERNYMLAGRPESTNVPKMLSLKIIFGVVGLVIGLYMFTTNDGILGKILLLAAPLGGYFAPDILINGQAKRRQEEIQYSLPDLLDQITISIESGTSFENALSRAGQSGEGPLADEVVRTVQDIGLGVSRRDAYDALVKRTDVEELRSFVRAIVQGEEFGVPVSEIVRDQAQQMRVARRLRAEGKANQVPVKMLMPLMVTILPVLFMIILGPAIIGAAAAFRGGA
jgi:tight adherence protein C